MSLSENFNDWGPTPSQKAPPKKPKEPTTKEVLMIILGLIMMEFHKPIYYIRQLICRHDYQPDIFSSYDRDNPIPMEVGYSCDKCNKRKTLKFEHWWQLEFDEKRQLGNIRETLRSRNSVGERLIKLSRRSIKKMTIKKEKDGYLF